ncbi:MAG: transcriptional regulator [Oceanospirillaceae bacterium]|nr:transcriptional regulator [Oceanospirillaceae bacterium]|tara:strand:+ start:1407 stop:1784 length:378 start_codon:yes stop_codon:yes gene_type:complete
MKRTREQQIDDAFFALSHPVRRQILERLSEGDASVADVSAPAGQSASQMTKHLQILERANLLSRRKQGRTHCLHFEPEALKEVMDWVSRYQQFWEVRLDSLEMYLHSLDPEEPDTEGNHERGTES